MKKGMNGIYCFIALLSFGLVQAQKEPAKQKIRLLQVMHNQAGAEQAMELASVVFYFDHDPIVNPLDGMAASASGQSFFLPMVEPSRECNRMVETLNEYKGDRYHVSVACVSKPVPGIRLTFFYDPEKVSLVYDMYESISLQKAVVFRLYDQEVARKLKESEARMLRVADSVSLKKKVVVDCGHGGADSGTIGVTGAREKDIALQVGRELEAQLRERGIEVVLTRTEDKTVSLDERASRANASGSDLFVSLHANASIHPTRNGIETYCLNDDLFSRKFSTLAHESVSSVQAYENERYRASNKLARKLHYTLVSTMQKHHAEVKDGHVRYAAPQVLVGSTMPSALVELGYLSNESEARRLASGEYQHLLAKGIADGVVSFLASA